MSGMGKSHTAVGERRGSGRHTLGYTVDVSNPNKAIES